MIYNTTFSRWLLFLASLGPQIEGFVGKAVGPRGSCACSFSTFLVVSGRWVFGSFAVAPGLGASGSDPPPDLGSGAGSLARVLRRVLHFFSGISVIWSCWIWSSFKWMLRKSPFIHSTRSAGYDAWSPYLTFSRRSRRAARMAWLYMLEDCIMSGDWSVTGCGFYGRIGVVLMTVLPIMWSGLLSIRAIPQF